MKWKYAAQCSGALNYVKTVVADTDNEVWGLFAHRLIQALRKTKPSETDWALHFLALSADSLKEGHHGIAKLCLSVAWAIADDKVFMAAHLDLFNMAFQRDKQGRNAFDRMELPEKLKAKCAVAAVCLHSGAF